MSTLRRLPEPGPYGPQNHKLAHVVRRAAHSNRYCPEFPISTLPLRNTLCLPHFGVKPGAPSVRYLASSESLISSCNTIGSRCRRFEISRSHHINRFVEVFFASWHLASNTTVTTSAFVGTNSTEQPIPSGLPVILPQSEGTSKPRLRGNQGLWLGEVQQHHIRTLLRSLEDDFTAIWRDVEVANVEVGSEMS